jgi:hypothetical protein
MAGPVGWCSPDNHACNFMSHPLVKSVRRDQAPTRFQRISECRLRCRRFRSCVNHLCGDQLVFCPRRNEPPLHQRQFPSRFLRILPDDRDGLSRSNVVAWSPVVFAGDAVEILFDHLLSARQSVATAHGGNYCRSDECGVTWQAGRDVCLRQGQNSIPRCPLQPILAVGRVSHEYDKRLRCLCSGHRSDLLL